MENNGFERFSEVWIKGTSAGDSQKIYSENEIKNIKMKTSKSFSKSLNNSIVFDYVLKGMLIVGMILLAWFYRTNPVVLIAIISLTGLSALFINKELGILKSLHKIDDYSKEVSEVIKLKLAFYKQSITPLRLMMAFTNALFVWVGSMFYFYLKYGYYKMEDFGDLFVTTLMGMLAFSISYFALTWQIKTNVVELEESLIDLDDEQQTDLLHMQLQRKRKQKIVMAVIAAIGIFLLSVLLLIYFR